MNEYINDLEVKRLIFDIFEISRELFNNYCNGKDFFSEEDYKKIYFELLPKLKNDINDIESEID